jgi:hypothetical protein
MADILALLAMLGCNDTALDIAREAANRQAEQNRQMAALQDKVADGATRLVEEEAQVRQDLLAVHRDLHDERSELWASWNSLESQRQSFAAARRAETALAALLRGSGAMFAAILSLALAWLALFGLRRHDDSMEVACSLLLEDFMASQRQFPVGDPRLPKTADAKKQLPAPHLSEDPL